MTKGKLKDIDQSKFQIEDLTVGTGTEVIGGDYITIHYVGILVDGRKFDSSYDRGQPFKTRIGVGEVIDGWDMGVIGMKVGGKRRLIIPSNLAYKDREIGIIPANATLVFDLELLGID